MTQRQAAWGLLAAAAVVAIWAIVNHSKGGAHAACALTTAGAATLVTLAHNGQTGEQVLLKAALPLACEPLLNQLVMEPTKEATFKLQVPTGTETVSSPGTEVLSPSPTTIPLKCLLYTSELQRRLCALTGG